MLFPAVVGLGVCFVSDLSFWTACRDLPAVVGRGCISDKLLRIGRRDLPAVIGLAGSSISELLDAAAAADRGWDGGGGEGVGCGGLIGLTCLCSTRTVEKGSSRGRLPS
jgi:hypothetical protein